MGKAKIPIILLHGALGSSASFNHLLPVLQEQYELFVPNLPGHAGSKFSEQAYCIESLSDFLSAYLKENGLNNVSVFGFSLGGYLALYHQWLFPNSFSRIITLGTKLEWNKRFALEQEQHMDPTTLRLKSSEYYESLQSIHGNNTENLLLSIVELMKKLGDRPLLNQRVIEEIKIPVLFSIGDRDRMVTFEETKRYSEWGKQSSICLVQNTSHPIEKLSADSFFYLLDFICGK